MAPLFKPTWRPLLIDGTWLAGSYKPEHITALIIMFVVYVHLCNYVICYILLFTDVCWPSSIHVAGQMANGFTSLGFKAAHHQMVPPSPVGFSHPPHASCLSTVFWWTRRSYALWHHVDCMRQNIIATSQWTGACRNINVTHQRRWILREIGRLSANRPLSRKRHCNREWG